MPINSNVNSGIRYYSQEPQQGAGASKKKKKTKKIQTSETTLVSLVSTSQSKIIP